MEWLIALIVAGVTAAGGWWAVATVLGKSAFGWVGAALKPRQEAKALVMAGHYKQEEEEKLALKEGKDEAKYYREKLLANKSEFTCITALGSNHPRPLDNAYVKLRVHEDRRAYDPALQQTAYPLAATANLEYNLYHHRLDERSGRAYEPAEAVSKHQLTVIIGDPGAGKSTLMRFLTGQIAARKLKDYDLPDLPVYVPLAQLFKFSETDPAKLLTAFVQDYYKLEVEEAFLKSRLKAGTILLLFDGLDEAGALAVTTAEKEANQPDKIIQMIDVLRRQYPEVPMVVTCRRASWLSKQAELTNFKVFEVLDFSWEDIQAFVKIWFAPDATPDVLTPEAARLIEELKPNVRMRFLAANPLLLSLICTVFDEYKELPDRRARLYEKCVDYLLTLWDSKRNLKRLSNFTTENKKDLLCKLAWHFQEKRQRYYQRDELLEWIADFLPEINRPRSEAGAVLQEIMINHGLLEEEGLEFYGFPHLTLQEYFCALALKRDRLLEPMLYHLGDPWWEEVTLLYATAEGGDAAPLLQALLEGQDDIFHTNLFLATRCLAGNPRISHHALRQRILDRAFALTDDKKQPENLRKEAVTALVDTGQAEVRQTLFARFQENLPDFDWALLNPLLPVLNRQQASELVNLLKDEQLADEVKRRIAESLGQLGGKEHCRRVSSRTAQG